MDGGTDNYWHLRATGDDPRAMLTTEFLPLLAKRGLETAAGGVQAGAHTAGYWRRMLPDQLAFLGGVLAR